MKIKIIINHRMDHKLFLDLLYFANNLPNLLCAIGQIARTLPTDPMDKETIDGYNLITEKLVNILFTKAEHTEICLKILKSL